MDLNRPEISYIFLVIPILFALTVLGQGIRKVVKEEADGPLALGFGVILLGAIAATYFFFIR